MASGFMRHRSLTARLGRRLRAAAPLCTTLLLLATLVAAFILVPSVSS
jgi:hypothetical protein